MVAYHALHALIQVGEVFPLWLIPLLPFEDRNMTIRLWVLWIAGAPFATAALKYYMGGGYADMAASGARGLVAAIVGVSLGLLLRFLWKQWRGEPPVQASDPGATYMWIGEPRYVINETADAAAETREDGTYQISEAAPGQWEVVRDRRGIGYMRASQGVFNVFYIPENDPTDPKVELLNTRVLPERVGFPEGIDYLPANLEAEYLAAGEKAILERHKLRGWGSIA
jgi:hypothetical protein